MPQTDERPRDDDPAWLARLDGVARALTGADPAEADAAFFPLSAYLQVKELPPPTKIDRDWRERLQAGYRADLAALRGPGGGAPTNVRFVTDPKRTRWVKPGEEYNKLGYHRTKGATLVFDVDGVERRVPVKAAISWRGQWYLVHLTQ